MIGIFRRPHWIRRWGNGARKDFKTKLNVQPMSSDDLQALPEGLRQTKRLKAWGSISLTAADQKLKKMGDWLYYGGRWYECVSCIRWDHTPLAHYESEFCMVDGSVAAKNLEPPQATPQTPPEEGGGSDDAQ